MSSIKDFLPFAMEKADQILEFLRSQKDLTFVSELSASEHAALLVLFLNRTQVPENYFRDRGIQLIVQSLVLKLRDLHEQKRGQFRKLLKRFPEPMLLEMVKMSPAIVLSELFQIRVGSNKKTVIPVRILNRYPYVFVNLILDYMKSGATLDLVSLVLNPVSLKLLARKLPIDVFLANFNKSPSEMYPLMGCNVYGKSTDTKTILFAIVAETLVLSAARQGTLSTLCVNAPQELRAIIPETISCLCATLEIIPESLYHFIPAIAARFGPAIFSQIRDPRALLHAAYIFVRENPDQANVIATILAERPSLWEVFGPYMSDMPSLGLAMGKYLGPALANKSAIPFIENIILTAPTAIACINRLRPFLPDALPTICSCAKFGLMPFRATAYLAHTTGCWQDFCKLLAGESKHAPLLLACVTDRIHDGDTDGALSMVYDMCTHYMDSSQEIKAMIADYVTKELTNLTVQIREPLLAYAKILLLVHKFSNYLIPMIAHILDTIDNKLLDLIIRYMWGSWNDPTPSFVIYRLKLMQRRCQRGRPPNFWSDEMLQIAGETPVL